MTRAVIIGMARQLTPHDFVLRRWWRGYKLWRQARRQPDVMLLRAFAKAYPAAFFMQIGSNDGEKLDPLRETILRQHWYGIMVEPVPYVFERLKANYEKLKGRISLANVAIADRNGELPFYHLARSPRPDEDGLPEWYDALGSFHRDVVLKHVNFIPDIAERLIETRVQCVTFDALCEQHGVTQVDLLHSDVEGYDYELLKTIDLERYRPRLLIYEHHHLSRADKHSCRDYLSARGYDMFEYYLDTWCLRTRDTGPRDRELLKVWKKAKQMEVRTPNAATA